MKYLNDIPNECNNIIVRVDWNVPIQNGVILDDERIVETLPTLKRLFDMGKRVRILSHLGRPNGEKKEELSLKPLYYYLKTNGWDIAWLGEDFSHPWEHSISLVENVRFFEGEERNDSDFSKQLAFGADAFVNDAFSVSHRKHASVYSIAERLPSFAGLLLEKEVKSLSYFLNSFERPLVVVCGGSKVSTKAPFIVNFLSKADTVALVGALPATFLAAQGKSVGKSLIEESAFSIISEIVSSIDKIWVPESFKVGTSLDSISRETNLRQISPSEAIFDASSKSVEDLLDICSKAKTVIWNGALGVLENPTWAEGGLQFAKGLSKLCKEGLQVLAGGGETVLCLKMADVLNDLTYVSMAGGAFMEFMEGKILPGIKVLDRK